MTALRERRDKAIARRLTVQNRILKGELIPRETVKAALGRASAAWRGAVQEHSRTTGPVILAVLAVKDPAADSRLRLLIDDEAYATAGTINRAMEQWLSSREAGTEAE